MQCSTPKVCARATGAQRLAEDASEAAQEGDGSKFGERGRCCSLRFSGRSNSQAEIWTMNVSVPEERSTWMASRQQMQRLRDKRKCETC